MNDEFEKAVKDAGFADMAEWHRMVAAADLGTPDKIAAFERWKNDDGSKAGLEKLPGGCVSKEITREEARRVVEEAIAAKPLTTAAKLSPTSVDCVLCDALGPPKQMRQVKVRLPDGSTAWALIDESKLRRSS